MARNFLLLVLLTRPSCAQIYDETDELARAATEHMKAARYQEAEVLFERAIGQWKKGGDPAISWAVTLSNLGTLHSLRGDYARAEQALGSALEMLKPLTLPSDIRRARILIGLGQIYIATARLKEARAMMEAALPFAGESEEDMSGAADAMGRLMQAEGSLRGAEEWFGCGYFGTTANGFRISDLK
jgi:tetratricopeptide (TPR) repeat protein